MAIFEYWTNEQETKQHRTRRYSFFVPSCLEDPVLVFILFHIAACCLALLLLS